MPGYRNWDEKMNVFENAEFLKLKDFIKSMYRIINRKCPTVTDEELAKLESLKVTRICGPMTRFPNDGLYVNVSFGYFADVISDLSDYTSDDPILKWQLRCALRYALRGYQCIDDDRCETFDRNTFEKRFNLRWSEGMFWKWIIVLSAGILMISTIIAES